ncbi:e3 ubiquitin-protein ligase RNF13 [Trichonephila clavipes]|nr:e3 ubiquitin-protein ligase RNF13 [Trichonephila clavipes]
MSWTYRGAVMVLRVNTRGGRVLQAMAPHTITTSVGALCRCKAKVELRRSTRGLHTRTRLSSLLRLNLDSSLKTTWFHSAAVQFPRERHHSKQEASMAAHVMDTVISNVLQPGAFVWFKKTQVTLVKVLPVPGWRPMKQLAVRAHFLRCDGLLDDWSVEGVLSLVIV